ncbi:GMC family oxidoreductase [Amycolatopsis jejuensis]|uniref:GMC family oxidoreductase n=1 Tax=Amycolatopsis jejuensis TaxID=330084 RepID=UPI0005259EB8|nr:GMC family oxidoreductase [Amycolatopsis jejuensis]
MTAVDVLIVGAGPSGAVAAHTLATRGFSVLCLEQGDWVSPAEMPGDKSAFELLTRTRWNWDGNRRGRREDYPLEVTDAEAPVMMFGAVGGSSVIYGAHWLRMLPSDFKVRTLDGVADDWPLDYADVEPYYRRVDEFIGVSGLAGDPAYPDQDFPLPPHPLGKSGMKMARAMNDLGWHWWPGTHAIPSSAFKSMEQCMRWGTCERGCPAGAKASFDLAYWPHAIAAGAQLVTGARVARITVDQRTGLADGAIWLDQDKVEHRVKANSVVLAANSVGTARILLMSDDRGAGLANSSGLVGRNLMIHPNVFSIGAYEDDIESWLGPAGQLLYSMEFYETDRARGFVRGAKWNLMPIPGILAALELFDDLPFDRRWGGQAHELSRFGGKLLGWYANADDLPEEHNRVTLDPSVTDDTGLPAAKISYRLSENTKRIMAFNAERMREAHEAAGAAHIVVRNEPMPSGHLLGTARMGTDPARSVVDPHGRSHDIPNLYIADGSVMVTGGGVNPTSTITALALRTAEHLAASAKDLPTMIA